MDKVFYVFENQNTFEMSVVWKREQDYYCPHWWIKNTQGWISVTNLWYVWQHIYIYIYNIETLIFNCEQVGWSRHNLMFQMRHVFWKYSKWSSPNWCDHHYFYVLLFLISRNSIIPYRVSNADLGPVLLTFLRHVARISANGIAAFKESCSPIG